MHVQRFQPLETARPRYADSPLPTAGSSPPQTASCDRILRPEAPLTRLAWTGEDVSFSAESTPTSPKVDASSVARESSAHGTAVYGATEAETSENEQEPGIAEHLVRAVDAVLRLDWRSSIRHVLSGVLAWLRTT